MFGFTKKQNIPTDPVDECIAHYLMSEFKRSEGVDVSKDGMAMQRLRTAAREARIKLASATEAEVHVPFLTATLAGPKHLNTKLSRAQLENLTNTPKP